MTKYAFGLSEQIQAPVFVRGVTCLSQSYSIVDIDDYVMPDDTVPHVKKDITKYAKAGAVMCMTQHQDAINRLAKGNEIIHADHLHSLTLGKKGGLGVICSSVAKSTKCLSTAEPSSFWKSLSPIWNAKYMSARI